MVGTVLRSRIILIRIRILVPHFNNTDPAPDLAMNFWTVWYLIVRRKKIHFIHLYFGDGWRNKNRNKNNLKNTYTIVFGLCSWSIINVFTHILYPAPDPLCPIRIRLRIQANDTDPDGSGSATLGWGIEKSNFTSI